MDQYQRVVNDVLFQDVEGTNLIPRLGEITIPVLSLWGRFDDLVPPELGQDVHEAFGTDTSAKRSVLFTGSVHQPFINEPDLFLAEITSFIQ